MTYNQGHQLGNYRILRFLGKGGFADVYLAEHIYLSRQVALKVLHAQTSGNTKESFIKEAQTIARLEHRNIVRVTDFGIDNETPFLVMDYAPNGTLAQRHPHGTQVPLDTVVLYVKQIAEALQYAHDERFIHRDVKPENMLIGRRNDILLSDFGIALIAQSSRYQNTQEFMGTVAYMSPEQIQGKPRPASDQYSLAVVVYKWLSGDYPFRGLPIEIITQHMSASPPFLCRSVPTLPPEIDYVINTALAKDPSRRFRNVNAFADALEQVSQTTVIKQSSESSTLAQSKAPKTRHVLSGPPSLSKGHATRAPIKSSRKVNLLVLSRKDLVKSLIGILSYAVCYLLYIYLNSFVADVYFNFTARIIGWLFGLLVVCIPQFFGVLYGRRIGLLTGAIGSLVGLVTSAIILSLWSGNNPRHLGFALPFLIFQPFVYGTWSIYPGFAIMGFISGFAPLRWKGRFNIVRSLSFSLLGLLIGMLFTFIVIGISTTNIFVDLNFFSRFFEVTQYYLYEDLLFFSVFRYGSDSLNGFIDLIELALLYSTIILIFIPLLLQVYDRTKRRIFKLRTYAKNKSI